MPPRSAETAGCRGGQGGLKAPPMVAWVGADEDDSMEGTSRIRRQRCAGPGIERPPPSWAVRGSRSDEEPLGAPR